MVELITEILIYLGIAALLGLVLGYLIWGWGTAARVSAARADGAAAARTSVDGNAGLREQLASSEAVRERLEEEVDRLTVELDACKQKHADAASASDDLPEATTPRSEEPPAPEATPALGQAVVAPANGDLSEAEPEPEPLPESEPEQSAVEAPESEPAPEADAPVLPKGLLTERPDEVDDLKQIKGVGKVMEGVLNDKGIYLFRQLASLNEQETAWVNDAIEAFPGRIHRDRWVEQSAQLYADKYGRSHDADD